MRWIKINWGEEKYKIPAQAEDYGDYAKGTVARREMYRLQSAIAQIYGQWLRQVNF